MAATPMFDSGGFRRDQTNAIAVVNPDGTPIGTGGTGGGGGGVVQLQIREGLSWVNAPGSSARGLLIEPAEGVAVDGGALPTKMYVVAGYDGANVRSIKTNAAGVLQVGVSGTPTVALDSPSLAALETVQIGSLPAVALDAATLAALESITVVDGGGSLTVDGPLTDTQLRASAVPVDTELPAGLVKNADNGLEVHVNNSAAAGGAGTEYTEGDIDATITGRAILWEDASDTLRSVSAAKPLPVAQQGAIALDSTTLAALESITVVDGGGALSIDDNAGSLTVDAPTSAPVSMQPVVAGAAVDPRAIRALTSGDVVTVANPTANPETGLAKDATLTGGAQKAIARGAAKGTTAAGDVTSAAVDANTQALHVQLAGTQPAVPVTDNGGSLTVDGTVTANAGTGPFPVSDNAGSLTVDAPVGTPIAVRQSDGAAFIDPRLIPLSMALDGAGAAQPIQFAAATATTAQTAAALVSAPAAGRSIRVLTYAIVVGAAMDFTFNGPTVAPVFSLAANGGVSFAGQILGPAFQLPAATALTYTTSAAGRVTIHLSYVIV